MSTYDSVGFNITPDDEQAANEQRGDFEPMPRGRYAAIIEEAEWKPTARGGKRLALTLAIQTPPHDKRKVWDSLNVECPGSAKAEQIARGMLTRLCKAVGLTNGFRDPGELCHKMFEVDLKIEPARDDYPPRNRVAQFVLPETAAPAPPKAPTAPPRISGPARDSGDVTKESAPW